MISFTNPLLLGFGLLVGIIMLIDLAMIITFLKGESKQIGDTKKNQYR